jgi:hypothetical protein
VFQKDDPWLRIERHGEIRTADVLFCLCLFLSDPLSVPCIEGEKRHENMLGVWTWNMALSDSQLCLFSARAGKRRTSLKGSVFDVTADDIPELDMTMFCSAPGARSNPRPRPRPRPRMRAGEGKEGV